MYVQNNHIRKKLEEKMSGRWFYPSRGRISLRPSHSQMQKLQNYQRSGCIETLSEPSVLPRLWTREIPFSWEWRWSKETIRTKNGRFGWGWVRYFDSIWGRKKKDWTSSQSLRADIFGKTGRFLTRKSLPALSLQTHCWNTKNEQIQKRAKVKIHLLRIRIEFLEKSRTKRKQVSEIP